MKHRTIYRGYRLPGATPRPARKKMSASVNLTGRRFGRLLVIEDLGVAADRGYRIWGCKCSCGTLCGVRSRELIDGDTKSCGCLAAEQRASAGGTNKLPSGESAFNNLFGAYQRAAAKRGIEWGLTKEQFRDTVTWTCYYCGAVPSARAPRAPGNFGDFIYNGVDRADNTRGYLPNNIRSCCKACNIAKACMTEEEFLDWGLRLYRYWLKKFENCTPLPAAGARFEHGDKPPAERFWGDILRRKGA